LFGRTGEIFFRVVEGNTGFVYRVRPDGTGLAKAISQPVFELFAVSPDGQWLVASSPSTGQASVATMAHPLRGGDSLLIKKGRPRWSPDGRTLYLSVTSANGSAYASGTTYAIPLSPSRQFPDFLTAGLSDEIIAKWPGVQVIEAADFAPGPSPDVYAFSRETNQRNLYRIPIP
jgi:hypothetical protein